MIRHITLMEVLKLHGQIIDQSGGAQGIRDLGLLESAVAQPLMTFGGEDLYPSLIEKAAALSFSIIMNHPFIDGNKRTGHAAMEVLLVLNRLEVNATVDEQEQIFLAVASGEIEREAFVEWLESHVNQLIPEF
jgi:death on curing protein